MTRNEILRHSKNKRRSDLVLTVMYILRQMYAKEEHRHCLCIKLASQKYIRNFSIVKKASDQLLKMCFRSETWWMLLRTCSAESMNCSSIIPRIRVAIVLMVFFSCWEKAPRFTSYNFWKKPSDCGWLWRFCPCIRLSTITRRVHTPFKLVSASKNTRETRKHFLWRT